MYPPTSKLTQKHQATIPAAIRKKLDLRAGDVIAFKIEDDIVIVRKARPLDIGFAQAASETLSEWASAEDENAYGDFMMRSMLS